MSFNELSFNWSFIQWAIMAVIGVYSWIIGRQSASAKELLDMRIRLATLEEKIQQVPTKSELARLEAQFESAAAQLSVAVRRLDGINEFLLTNK